MSNVDRHQKETVVDNNTVFFANRLISRNGTLSWPAKSPDFSVTDLLYHLLWRLFANHHEHLILFQFNQWTHFTCHSIRLKLVILYFLSYKIIFCGLTFYFDSCQHVAWFPKPTFLFKSLRALCSAVVFFFNLKNMWNRFYQDEFYKMEMYWFFKYKLSKFIVFYVFYYKMSHYSYA